MCRSTSLSLQRQDFPYQEEYQTWQIMSGIQGGWVVVVVVSTYPLTVTHVHTHSQGSKRHFNRPSTFFSALAPRVLMGGDSGASSQDGTQQDSSDDVDDDDDSLSDLLDGPLDDDVDDVGYPVKVIHFGVSLAPWFTLLPLPLSLSSLPLPLLPLPLPLLPFPLPLLPFPLLSISKCVSCSHQVCTGVYWRCAECPADMPTILCHNCVDRYSEIVSNCVGF